MYQINGIKTSQVSKSNESQLEKATLSLYDETEKRSNWNTAIADMRRTITPNTYTVSSAALSHPDPHMKPPPPHIRVRMGHNVNPSETGRSLLPLLLTLFVKRACKIRPLATCTNANLTPSPQASEIVPRTSTLREKITKVVFVLFQHRSPAYCM